MHFTHLQYIPCLQWKLGEYQAMSRLPVKTKRLCTPLIEVPAIGYDFEDQKKAKTVDMHLAPKLSRSQLEVRWPLQAESYALLIFLATSCS